MQFPDVLTLQLHKVQDLRYGENPHQTAAFYRDAQPVAGGLARYRQVQGKELSYNNIADADAAWECVKSFSEPACVIVKHANPCGVAVGANLRDAYARAFATDPMSAFGGILAFNRALDRATAEAIGKQFAEVIIAPRVEARGAEGTRRQGEPARARGAAGRTIPRRTTTSASAAGCWSRVAMRRF